MKLFAIGAAGFFGAIARYLAGGAVQNMASSTFPWGTLAVNLSGSFLLGLVLSVAAERFTLDPQWRTAIAIGFIGSYTTFSTLSFETLGLMESSSWLYAVINALVSIIGGLSAVYAGSLIGRLI